MHSNVILQSLTFDLDNADVVMEVDLVPPAVNSPRVNVQLLLLVWIDEITRADVRNTTFKLVLHATMSCSQQVL